MLRYDHRGHGGSDVVPGPVAIEDLAGDVVEMLDELELESVSFCGLSIGGAVGMAFAAANPERVDRLVLACTSVRFGPPEGWYERASVVREEGLDGIADELVGRWFTPTFRAAQPETVARFRSMLVATPREGYAACCDALARWDFRGELHRIAAPTLVIAAAEDPSTPPAHGEAIAAGTRRRARRARAGSPRGERRAAGSLLARAPAPPRAGGGGMTDERHDEGMRVRREVLGDEHVDRAVAGTTPFTADFQDLITRYAWGEIWARPGLDRKTRSCITLTALTALNHHEELAMHVRAALRNGVTADEIKEVLLQAAIYCGVPAANRAFAIAQGVLAEEEQR